MLYIVGIYFHFALYQFRNVVRIKQEVVVIRIPEASRKGFGGCSIFVYMHQIGKRINAVLAPAAY
jgi:hypothetical protein